VRRRIPIRIKLAAALAIPIAALLFVSVLEVVQSTNTTKRTKEQTELAEAATGPGGLITTLQNERNYGAVWLLGFENSLELPVTSYAEATAATDASIASFKQEIARRGGDVAETFGPTIEQIEADIGQLRDYVNNLPPDTERGLNNTPISEPFYLGYVKMIDALFKANSQVAPAIDDATLRRGVELTILASREIESTGRIVRVFLLAGVNPGAMLDTPQEIGDVAGLQGQYESDLASVQQLATGRYEESATKAINDVNESGYRDLVTQGLEAAGTGPVNIQGFINSVSRSEGEGWNGFRVAANEELSARADELNANAARSQKLYIALALLAVAVAFVVTWLVSRSITRPLRSLTRQAKEMAERRLPEAVIDILETPLGEDVTVPGVEPIMVNTRDEVSDVADALNTVQDSALDLAVEQAVLRRNIADSFVNLGRRNQNLLGRQLDFITELETNETDADTLANLFRLDHLATRMRRNAESLLVLAGIEPPRQWAAPVRLTDVIRAALGEVEDYQRVTVRGVEPATILGSAAADLAHLLAELIENALVFSPPDQTVDIRGRNRPDGYTLAIIDSGLGMPPTDVASANRRLAGAESFTIAPSKYLGHYVAGNLAARHDIAVHLENSPGNGITATIDLPPVLLTSDEPVAEPISEPHGTPAVVAAANQARRPAPQDGFPAPALAGPAPGPVPAPAPMGASPWAGLDIAAPREPMRPAARAPEPPHEATRTASGLVKRARRSGGDSEPAMPDADVLASMTSITNHNGPRTPLPPAPELVRADEPVPPAPLWSALTSRHPTTPTGPNGGSAARPVTSRSWPAPPSVSPAPSEPEQPALPPLQPLPPADGGGQTAGGLARRVRGAQMPSTQPLSVRRSQDHPSEPPAGYRREDHGAAGRNYTLGNGNGNGSTNGQGAHRDHDESTTARSVYAFLTSFTQGVQRGLDETRRDPNFPKETS
jgi:signal transduction histidine kinase